METIATNKHFNIEARIRHDEEDKVAVKSFLAAKTLKTLAKKCCGSNPSLNLRYINLKNSTLNYHERRLFLDAFAGKDKSLDDFLNYLAQTHERGA